MYAENPLKSRHIIKKIDMSEIYTCEWCGRKFVSGEGYRGVDYYGATRRFCSDSCFQQASENPNSTLSKDVKTSRSLFALLIGIGILMFVAVVLVVFLFTPSIILFSSLLLADVQMGAFSMWLLALLLCGAEFCLYYFLSNKNVKASIITLSVVHVLLIIVACFAAENVIPVGCSYIVMKMLPFLS